MLRGTIVVSVIVLLYRAIVNGMSQGDHKWAMYNPYVGKRWEFPDYYSPPARVPQFGNIKTITSLGISKYIRVIEQSDINLIFPLVMVCAWDEPDIGFPNYEVLKVLQDLKPDPEDAVGPVFLDVVFLHRRDEVLKMAWIRVEGREKVDEVIEHLHKVVQEHEGEKHGGYFKSKTNEPYAENHEPYAVLQKSMSSEELDALVDFTQKKGEDRTAQVETSLHQISSNHEVIRMINQPSISAREKPELVRPLGTWPAAVSEFVKDAKRVLTERGNVIFPAVTVEISQENGGCWNGGYSHLTQRKSNCWIRSTFLTPRSPKELKELFDSYQDPPTTVDVLFLRRVENNFQMDVFRIDDAAKIEIFLRHFRGFFYAQASRSARATVSRKREDWELDFFFGVEDAYLQQPMTSKELEELVEFTQKIGTNLKMTRRGLTAPSSEESMDTADSDGSELDHNAIPDHAIRDEPQQKKKHRRMAKNKKRSAKQKKNRHAKSLKKYLKKKK